MTKVHREIFDRVAPARSVTLDTAYGFQGNVPQMTEKLVDYFQTSLRVVLTPLHFDSYANASELEREVFSQEVREADYVFAGPGSPSYALTQWRPLNLGADLHHVLQSGGAVCFASAAALTLGAFTAPIYEIYKVGVPAPYWLDGLDLMSRLGLRCAVIPHFDNREGQNYDTRFCYLGERNLHTLEAQLPAGVATLGVDEHTALIFDLEADTFSVRGRGNAYWRLGGEMTVLTGGPSSLELLRATSARVASPAEPHPSPARPAGDLETLARDALAGGPAGLAAVAALVRRASAASDGALDPAPFIDTLIDARDAARGAGLYEVSDRIRAALVAQGIEIHDAATGTTWSRTTTP